MDVSNLIKEIESISINEYAFLKPKEVIFSEEVRSICEGNSCGLYGSSWACPPALGSLEECKSQCLTYENAFIFSTVGKVKNSFDSEGWLEARKKHENTTEKIAQIFRKYFKNPLILSSEGCLICKKCTYPDKPCRFPEKMYPATEGYGILVMKQAQICNIKYNNGPNTVTYFSMIFYS